MGQDGLGEAPSLPFPFPAHPAPGPLSLERPGAPAPGSPVFRSLGVQGPRSDPAWPCKWQELARAEPSRKGLPSLPPWWGMGSAGSFPQRKAYVGDAPRAQACVLLSL